MHPHTGSQKSWSLPWESLSLVSLGIISKYNLYDIQFTLLKYTAQGFLVSSFFFSPDSSLWGDSSHLSPSSLASRFIHGLL